MVGKAGRCHPGNRFFTLCHCSISLSFPQSILAPVQNDDFGKARHQQWGTESVIMTKNEKRHPEHERRIYSRSEENGNTSAEVIDSSLCVTIPFPVFLEQHFCLRSE